MNRQEHTDVRNAISVTTSPTPGNERDRLGARLEHWHHPEDVPDYYRVLRSMDEFSEVYAHNDYEFTRSWSDKMWTVHCDDATEGVDAPEARAIAWAYSIAAHHADVLNGEDVPEVTINHDLEDHMRIAVIENSDGANWIHRSDSDTEWKISFDLEDKPRTVDQALTCLRGLLDALVIAHDLNQADDKAVAS